MRYNIFFCLFTITVYNQIINFTDPVFKARLISANTSNGITKNSSGQNFKLDNNNNGEIEVSEAVLVFELNISTSPINTVNDVTDVSGIDFFSNLRKLNCVGNQLTTLNLNQLTNLEDINCSNNQITNLQVTNLIQLKSIKASFNNLTSLNLNGLINLETLLVHNNNLTSLELNNVPNLTTLKISENQFLELDLSVTPNIKYVICHDNFINNLVVENLPELIELFAGNNQISSINLNGLSNLRFLSLYGNQLAEIDINNLSSLSLFEIGLNPITSLNVDGLNSLGYVNCSSTLIKQFDGSQSGILQLFCQNNPLLTTINVKNNIHSYSDPDMLFFAFNFNELPLLESICMDNSEIYNLNYTNYNYNNEVVIYTGENCDILTDVPPMNNKDFTFSQWKIFPNPTENDVNIQVENDVIVYQIIVFTTLGQQIKKTINSSTIDLSELSSGVYGLEVSSSSGKFYHKVIRK